ncbi:MAG: sigma-54-dependent Fis family transcriptional regulator [Flavobacteriia bacterium]|uniref:Sigma-54 dependent transcriptional regulator n=1 Tax=Chryseobacterium suipulveris TaxID=2929800 RepID=A0ABY4BSH7_9FLAO|nr:sigma-54 dependent transcriptional regulator [Chryseobacterium suipulveris]MBN9294610.1 sigma-54-dependent Fis family transcriptional regulator [Flavobacteriia bacterium]OJX36317.1 MAG: sigma-54-dependent Fis family transcriptional regulator [Flavobacteriia bacterium 40-80]UOE42154.1 sigma-54 dependent transcriptional regulator [Chryseobacterium suipulveris]
MSKVLIIDDEEKIRTLLSKIITLEGFDVLQAGDIKSGLKKLETADVDAVICDVKLPDGSGVEATKNIKEKYPSVEIILLTAYGNIADGVQAMKNGAFDYITKGDDNNKIIPLLYKATEKVTLSKRVMQLEKLLGNKYSFDNIIGKSKTLGASIDAAKKVADSETTVLLTGETGTGKEVFAQAIHNASNRNKQNFVAVNCSAFSKELLENELFGHKAGAFTGAVKDSKGIFEEANHGTVFLDEIGEMPLDLQAKLLRVLETGEFLKVGDSKPTKVNVRIIAATNRNLQQEVEEGHFREDLFYRIAVFQISLPPLRERVIDIEELAIFFLRTFTNKTNKKINTISKNYLEALKQHTWKGNIRELKNVIERSVILTGNTELEEDSLPLELQRLGTLDNREKTLSAFELASVEKVHIQKVLNYTNGNKTETAKLLNIALTTLYRKIDEYHIK